jgi:hypothetical protein
MGKSLVFFVFLFFTKVSFSQSDCKDYSVKKQAATMYIKGIKFCGDEITIHERTYDVLNFQDLGDVVEITFGYPEYGGRKMGAIAIEKGKGEVQAIIELYRAPDDPSTKTKGNLILQKKETAAEIAERRKKEAEEERVENEKRAREAAEVEKRMQNLLRDDQQLYPNIRNLLTYGNLEVAKAEIQKLNFPRKFPYLNELYKKEDALLKTQIKNLLSEKKFDEAIKKYDALNLEDTKNELNSEMKVALSEHYKKFEQPFKEEQLAKLINENKIAFAKLSVGSYKVTSDAEGNLSIDGRTLGIKSSPLTKTMGKNSEFILNTCASGTIKIEQTASNNGAEQILVSTTKPIFETGKGKLYKYIILGGPGIYNWGNHTKIENITIQEDIPRNRYRKVQPLIIRTTANGIEIDSKKENKLLSENKFKNRALAVFSRSLMLGVFVFSVYIVSF